MSSTSNGALGTATNLFSGDASAALTNNLMKGKVSISDDDSPLQAFLAPGMHQLGIIGGSDGGGSSGGGGAGSIAQAPQQSQTSSGPAAMPAATAQANGSALSTLGNTNTSPTSGQNGMGGYVQPSMAGVATGLGPTGSTSTNVGNSQLGNSLISSSGTPMTMYQMLLQGGRATSGY